MRLEWKRLTVLVMLATATQGWAQTNMLPDSGNVGIGTTTPFAGTSNHGLHLSKGGHSSILFGEPLSAGYGGIVQTSDTRHRIFIGANLYYDQSESWGFFEPGKGAAGISVIADKGGWGTSITFTTSEVAGEYKTRMRINEQGNIGIGTTNPTERLTVSGTTKAEEVIVAEDVGADFVFEPDYDLSDLSEVEAYIKQNRHLPEVPPASEMIREGVRVGELQMKLLQKIEELTLYLIEQQKRIEALETELLISKQTDN